MSVRYLIKPLIHLFGAVIAFWAVLALMIAPSAFALNAPVEVPRGEISLDFANELVIAQGAPGEQATMILGDVSVTADQIEYGIATQVLRATGDVKIWDEGRILRGDRLLASFTSDEGLLEGVKEAELTRGVFFTGERLEYSPRPAGRREAIDGVDTVREYTLYNGTVTGNDLPIPHYYTRFERLVVVPNVRYWVHDMTLVAQSIPIAYLPFFSRSLRENRVAYYIYANHYSRHGFALFNRINYTPSNEYMIDLYGDYYTESGFGKGGRFTWDIEGEYGPEGTVYGYHIKQQRETNSRIFVGEDRYFLQGDYAQELPWDMRLTMQGHLFSDSQYSDDYRRPEHVREIDVRDSEKQPVSFVNLVKRFEDQSLRITGAHRFDRFYYSGLPYVEREPQIHFQQYPTRLFGTGLYGELQLDYGRYNREQGLTFPLNKDELFQRTDRRERFDRFDADGKLSYPLYLPERFTLKPWMGYRATHYSDPQYWGDDPNTPGFNLTEYNFDDETRLMLQGGMDLSTRRTMEFNPFLSRYDRMRMVMEPVIQYGYYHPDTDLETLTDHGEGRFPYIDPTDDFRAETHSITTMLRTRLQGQDSAGFTSDFLRLGAGFAYEMFPDKNLRFDNLTFFDDVARNDDHRFSDLVQEFSVHPARWLTVGNNLRYDLDDEEMRSAYYYTTLSPLEQLNLNVGYYTFRYPFIRRDEQRDLVSNIQWAVNNKWQLYYRLRFDVEEERFRRNTIGLVRNMYDFFGVFEVEHENHPTLGDDYSFHFRFQVWGFGPGPRGGQRGDMPLFTY